MNFLLQNDWYKSNSHRVTKKTFQAGDVITLQGEPVRSVGYVLTGKAKAISFSEAGAATWVGYFEPGEFFGHTSLLTKSETHFEISAETKLEAVMVSVDVMQDLLKQQDGLSLKLANDLAARLDQMTLRLIEAFTLSAKGRVCAELSRLSRIIGITPENLIIRPSPVFVDVAQRVNSTRETVSRTVSELQRKGIISREPGALVINSPERLKAAIQ